MTRPVRLGEFASAELDDAVCWYEARRPGLGADLLDPVDQVLRVLEEPALIRLVNIVRLIGCVCLHGPLEPLVRRSMPTMRRGCNRLGRISQEAQRSVYSLRIREHSREIWFDQHEVSPGCSASYHSKAASTSASTDGSASIR